MAFDYKTIAILGGTGSFGNAMAKYILENTNATLRIISRDEMKQSVMKNNLYKYIERIRFLLGDIRDLHRLNMALFDVELVIHAAALKYVDSGEYDPEEFVKTNINGTQNVIHACINNGIQKAVFLSSDKAVQSWNLYGNTKAVAEKLWTRANGYSPHGTEFVALRYGNVARSRGSVIEKWEKCLINNLPLSITDLSMTRFYISLPDAVALAWFAACYAPRGTILVPHLSCYTMRDLMQALCEASGVTQASMEFIGKRPGEKDHEMLMTDDEAQRLVMYTEDGATPKYYAIHPVAPSWEMRGYEHWSVPDPVLVREPAPWRAYQLQHRYESNVWPWRLSVEELRQWLREDL